MNEITVTLPESVKEYVEDELATGRHASIGDVLCHLVHMERKRRAREVLKRLVQEADASGVPEEVTPAYWEGMRQQLHDAEGTREAAS